MRPGSATRARALRPARWALLCVLLCACADDESPAGMDAQGTDPDAAVTFPESSDELAPLDRSALQRGNRGLDCDEPALEARVQALLARMTLEQKLFEMHGRPGTFFDAGGDEGLGIPALLMNDGPRGVARSLSTVFPVAMARGATFDPELERRVGEAIALELRASQRNMLLAPCINVLRHPGWGRAQETYSEDPYHMTLMGLGFIGGAQQHVLASAKHFAANSIENTRFSVSANLEPRTLHDVYLPHFEAAVKEARVASVMTAYNRVNGLYASENPELLRDILKDGWGFRGFVVSDWVLGTRSTAPAVNAGLDLEMPAATFFTEERLLAALDAGEIDMSHIDDAVVRILRMKLCFGLDALPEVASEVVRSEAHLALAEEVAVKSMVLLKNVADTLPLDPARVRRIGLFGALAASEDTGDRGSSRVLAMPGEVVSPLDGIRAAAAEAKIELLEQPTDSPDPAALEAARELDVAIVVVGLSHLNEGEYIPTNAEGERGGDRTELGLPETQRALIHALAARAPRTVVVLVGGSAILVRDFVDDVDALLMSWYAGHRGGTALGKVLFGRANPGGRLPVSFAREPAHWPPWDVVSDEVQYDYLHGYRLMEVADHEPEFEFGFGLDYTRYEYARLRLEREQVAADGALVVRADVHNAGERASDAVVQLYVSPPGDSAAPASKRLRGFRRVPLAAGQAVTVRFEVPAAELAQYEAGRWQLRPGTYRLWVGGSSRKLPLQATFTVEP